MFKRMTLQMRLTTAFLFMGLLVLSVALIGWSGSLRLRSHIDTLSGTSLPSLIGLWKVKEGQTQIESSERALVNPRLSSEKRQAEYTRIQRAWLQIDEGFKQYEPAPRTQEEDIIYQQLQVKWQIWQRNHEEFLQLARQLETKRIDSPHRRQLELIREGKENSPEMIVLQAANEALNQISERAQANRSNFEGTTQLILKILKINEDVAAQAIQSANSDASQSIFWVLIGTVLGPITAVLFGIIFSRTIAKPLGAKIIGVVGVAQQISAGDLTTKVENLNNSNDEIGKLLTAFESMTKNLNVLIRQVQQSGIQVTTSATKIAASGKQLEATVTEQVASTHEVVATAKEIAATSKQLTYTMEEVAGLSQSTTTAATDSQADLTRMAVTMQQLTTATTSIASKLEAINEKANNINGVVTTITKVADQTNLLSLNAAIEAEKAGEAGLGFAVVAREIRRLADQTAVATLDIEQMVKEMRSAVTTGVMEMDKFTQEVGRGVEDVGTISEQLGQIIEQVRELTPRFETVSQGMEAQSQGAEQISEAMEQLSETSGQTAGSLREINSAIEQLNQAAQKLRHEISRFRVHTEELAT